MKLILCNDCKDTVAMSWRWRDCDCGKSGGRYKEDGDRIVIDGPCTVYGLDNRVFITGRADAFLYPEGNGKVERKAKYRVPPVRAGVSSQTQEGASNDI